MPRIGRLGASDYSWLTTAGLPPGGKHDASELCDPPSLFPFVLFLPPSYSPPCATLRLGRVRLGAVAAGDGIAMLCLSRTRLLAAAAEKGGVGRQLSNKTLKPISGGFAYRLRQRTRAVLAERTTSWSDSLPGGRSASIQPPLVYRQIDLSLALYRLYSPRRLFRSALSSSSSLCKRR